MILQHSLMWIQRSVAFRVCRPSFSPLSWAQQGFGPGFTDLGAVLALLRCSGRSWRGYHTMTQSHLLPESQSNPCSFCSRDSTVSS